MANIKQTILKKKIGEVIYELLVKTTSTMVYVDETTTLETKLTSMIADITDSKTKLATLIGDDEVKSITSQIDAAVAAAVAALKNEEDPASLAGKIKAINDAVTAINDPSTGILATAKSYTDEKIGISGTSFSTAKEYIDDKVASVTSALAGAFHFKGSVGYIDKLPTEGVSEGDVYQVTYQGTSTEAGTKPLNAEFAFNGTEFVELGSVVDLSAYSTTEQMTSAINTAASNAKSEAIAAAASDATTKADAAKDAAISAAAADATSKVEAATTEINATVATKARFIVSATEPLDLTESDVWAQVVNE